MTGGCYVGWERGNEDSLHGVVTLTGRECRGETNDESGCRGRKDRHFTCVLGWSVQ